MPTVTKYKTLFLSDIHLGYPLSQVQALSRLLDSIDFEELYLIGDIIDLWYLKQNQTTLFNPEHVKLFERIRNYSQQGKKVFYVYGNHDEYLANPLAETLINSQDICFAKDFVYESLMGKKYFIVHGEDFDIVDFGQTKKVTRILGDATFRVAVSLDLIQGRMRNILGGDYWSLVGFASDKIRLRKIKKLGMSSLEYFERAVAFDTHKRGFDGVICGHIHIPASKLLYGTHYLNTGDWVKSCTALVETYEGNFEFLKFFPKTKIHK